MRIETPHRCCLLGHGVEGVGRWIALFSVCALRWWRCDVRLVVALLGSAKSLSFAMPTILDAVEGSSASVTVKDVCIGYAALGPGMSIRAIFVRCVTDTARSLVP